MLSDYNLQVVLKTMKMENKMKTQQSGDRNFTHYATNMDVLFWPNMGVVLWLSQSFVGLDCGVVVVEGGILLL